MRRFSLRCHADSSVDLAPGPSVPRILLVEDSAADVGLVREALDEHNVECDLFVIGDGEGAIAFMDEIDAGEADRPNLVLLDLNLPRKSGHEVLSHLRASHSAATVPVIIMTSSDGDKDRELAASLGANQYIRKPSRLDEFLNLGLVFKTALQAA